MPEALVSAGVATIVDTDLVVAMPCSATASRARELLSVHAAQRTVRVVMASDRQTSDLSWLTAHAVGAAALLVIGRATGPRGAASRPAVVCPDGRPVAVGWMPDDGAFLAGAAAAARSLATRTVRPRPMIGLLGQRTPRATAVADAVMHSAEVGGSADVRRWTADRAFWDDVRVSLGAGLAAVMYVGVGHIEGWPIFGGMTANRLGEAIGARPAGAVLAITCRSAHQRDGRPSFADELVGSGCCGVVLAAAGDVPHAVNARLAPALVGAIGAALSPLGGPLRFCDVVASLDSDAIGLLNHYCITGDPFSPLTAASEAGGQAPDHR